MQMSATDYRHVSFALELIMLRSGILYTPDCEWSRVQIDCMLTAHVSIHIHNRFYFHSFLSFTLCTSCTNFMLNK